MATYTINNPPTMLAYDDHVVFVVDSREYRYKVADDHLTNPAESNAKIFEVLGLDPEQFLKEPYGYEPQGGIWPTTESNDYAALTRAVWALYGVIATRQPKKTTKAKQDFASGARVRIVNKSGHLRGCSVEVGDLGTISRVDRTDNTVLVKFDTHTTTLWAKFIEVEVVNQRPTFKASSGLFGDGDATVFKLVQDGADVNIMAKCGDAETMVGYFRPEADGGFLHIVSRSEADYEQVGLKHEAADHCRQARRVKLRFS